MNKLKYILVGVLSVVLISTIVAVWSWRSAPCFQAEDVNLGEWDSGVAYGLVKITNAGKKPLQILDVKTCCGLDIVGDYPSILKKGITAVIPIRTHTISNKADGSFKRTVTFHTNDPEQPKQEVLITGRDTTALKVLSGHLGTVKPGQPVNIKLGIVNDKLNVEALHFALSSNKLNVEDVETSSDNVIKLTLNIDKTIPRGPLKEFVYIKTGLSARSYVVIPIRAIVEKGIRVRPEMLLFRDSDGSIRTKKKVKIDVLDGSWEGFSVECDHDLVSIEKKQVGKSSYALECLLNDASIEKGDASLIIKNQRGEECRIPVKW